MARKKQKTLVIFPDLLMGTKKLTNVQFGELMRGVLEFRFEEKEPTFDDPFVDMAYSFIKPQLLRYQEICETNSNNRTKSKKEIPETAPMDHEVQRNATECNEMQRKATQNQTQNQTQIQNQNQNQDQSQNQPQTQTTKTADEPPKVGGLEEASMRIKAPSCVELEEFRNQEGLIHVDIIEFWTYYHMLGWKDEKGMPIRDWRALLRSWDQNRSGQ